MRKGIRPGCHSSFHSAQESNSRNRHTIPASSGVLAAPFSQTFLISPIQSETLNSPGFWLTAGAESPLVSQPESSRYPSANAPVRLVEAFVSDRRPLCRVEPIYSIRV